VKHEITEGEQGLIVKVGKAELPGFYTNRISAEKAAALYIAKHNQSLIERKEKSYKEK
jgi:hypothetical protein